MHIGSSAAEAPVQYQSDTVPQCNIHSRGLETSQGLAVRRITAWWIEALCPTKWELVAANSCGTVYPKKYAHGFVVLCFVVVLQSFIMNSHEVFIHIHQGCFAGTGAIVRLPQCQWSKPDGYGKISQCITTTKHSKAKPCAYFLGYTVYRTLDWD